jgi:hypothetical protein
MHTTVAAAPSGFVRVRHTSSKLKVRDGALFRGLDDAIFGLGLHILRWNERRELLFVDDHWWPDACVHQVRFYDECGFELSERHVNDRFEALKRRRREAWQRAEAKTGKRYRPDSFRNGPVPRTGRRGRWSHLMRVIPTSGERRYAEAVAHDEDCQDLGIRVRAKRRGYNLPDTRDDVGRSDYDDCGWKSHRRNQWRAAR